MNDLVLLAVAGAHLTGMPLNHELTRCGATCVRTCRTNLDYELYELCSTSPPKPGLVRRPGFRGPGIEVEVWSLSVSAFGRFVADVPAPMTIGNVVLDDDTIVKGFSCEPCALVGARNITHFGGWRSYVAAQGPARRK